MAEDQSPRHALTGFPEASIHLLRALEEERQRIATDHGLSTTELRGLFRIAESGDLTPKQLAADLSVTSGAITGISGRLVAAGFLRRVAHPQDRRSLRLQLMGEGYRAVAAIHADFDAMVGEATLGLGREDLAVATEVLRRVTQALRVRHAASRMPGLTRPTDTA